MQPFCLYLFQEVRQCAEPKEINKMNKVNMQTEDCKKYVFTEQADSSWLLTWEDCGEQVSEVFTEEEKKEIVIGWLKTGHVNF